MRQDWEGWQPRGMRGQGEAAYQDVYESQAQGMEKGYFERPSTFDTGAYGQHPYVDELGRPYAQEMYKGERPDKMGLGQMMEAPQMPGMPYQMPTSGGKPFQYPDRSGGKPFQVPERSGGKPFQGLRQLWQQPQAPAQMPWGGQNPSTPYGSRGW